MLYSNQAELLQLLRKSGLEAQKKLGQNFLINPQVLEKIIAAGEVSSQDFVVEVGPGIGILTDLLAQQARQLQTIEFDPNLIPHLKDLLQKYPNTELLHADALHTKLPHEPYKVIANIPYYITSPLLNHFLQPKKAGELRPQLLVLLVQKEVAEKVCAKDGDHSILSLQVQIFGQPQIVMNVGKNSFYPAPQVDSAIIKVAVYENPLIADTSTFFKLISAAFSQKRKTLLNSFQNNLKLEKSAATALLEQAGISHMERPQRLSIEQWGRLVDAFQ